MPFDPASPPGLRRDPLPEMPFDPVDPKQSFPKLEEGILQYWQAENVFQRSITMRRGGEDFSFYDGPPFATGLPHYGHLLAGTIKDIIPRFQTMRGKKVDRKFGWDCHGLPVEYEVEKEQGIKTRREIEAMGVARFNELCRDIVQRYVKEWRQTVERMGRYVDMDQDYRTMDPDYMESIWWAFSALYEKGLLKEGHKAMHVCPRCVTPLSNFEVSQGYKDITDESVYVLFKSTTEKDTYFLAWTTTPWTLPGNLFLAVHPDLTYTKVIHNGKTIISVQPLLERIFKDLPYEKTGAILKGSDLVGMSYEPLFPYFAKDYPTAFRVVAGTFVTVEDGTGIVHVAPGFGEDDEAVGRREKVPVLQHVTMDGKFVPAVKDFVGMDVKPKDNPSATDKAVIAYLENHGLLLRSESFRHSYPHCWRCESPLLNYATSSWFVTIDPIKRAMLAANKKTEWVPEHLRDGRFGKWLEGARDWAISRNRYWGTPLPVWRVEAGGETVVMKNRDDLLTYKPMRFTKVTAVRHGEAMSNVAHILNGLAPGMPLSKDGKKQAAEAAAFLKDQKVSVIYCSPMKRTMETADVIAKVTKAKIIIDERITESGFGKYEGMTFDERDMKAQKARRMVKFETRDTNGWHYQPGMEESSTMAKRMSDFLRDVLPRHRSQHIVVVSHGAPLIQLRGFFTREDPYKLSVLPLPGKAEPAAYYWDHDADAQVDLHKHFVDGVQWPVSKPLAEAVHLTIVRHGETQFNKEVKLQGGDGEDFLLTENGRGQALTLAQKMKKQKKYDVIVSSPQKRAVETAQIIAKELGMTDVVMLEGLRERRFGEWAGRTVAELKQEIPQDFDPPFFGMHHLTPEGGESLSQFLRRTEDTASEILRLFPGKKVIVVCHRGSSAALRAIAGNLRYRDAVSEALENCGKWEISLQPFMKRIPEVLDCWFESGSMPYAQQRYPYRYNSTSALKEAKKKNLPIGFPADFIAEGIDQTRGWFYTLIVLSSALFGEPAFRHVIVNGTVLAEDGRKMSKRLKNYPEPGILIDKYGADALRFALMSSPAVKAEDIRFSEKVVEETLRRVLLPLWNSYSFFVTYASLAKFEPQVDPQPSSHPLDQWLLTELQDLTNKVTESLESYDITTACTRLADGLDSLTNWYIRLSRRRFAGKGTSDAAETSAEQFSEDQRDALSTLYQSLLTFTKLLAPFCPFISDSIYLNLTQQEHASVHLTDWPKTQAMSAKDGKLLRKTELLRRVVSLGLQARSNAQVKVRTPLRNATIACPGGISEGEFSNDDRSLLAQELNVKDITFTKDPGSLGERIVQVNARLAGPRLGSKVQDVIAAGKRGEFKELKNGSIEILGHVLTQEEAPLHYRGADGVGLAAEKGVIVSLDTHVDNELILEGEARDLIRFIQQQRKLAGLTVSDRITLQIQGADDLMKAHGDFITQQTNATMGASSKKNEASLALDDKTVKVSFHTA